MELFRSGDYLETLRKRAGRSRVYSRHQLVGLLMAEFLDDRPHKALYMRLAKRPDAEYLLRVAKEVGSRKGVKNKGAYFMRIVPPRFDTTHNQWKSSQLKVITAKRSSVKKQRSLFGA